MSFGEQMKCRRGELQLSRTELAARLGVSPSAVSNYENGLSFPKEEVMLRLFDGLETEPNILFRDSFQGGSQVMSGAEWALLRQYRGLSPMGRETVRSVVEALCAYRDEAEVAQHPEPKEQRVIPLYHGLAAAGYASPVFGEDFDYISVADDVPQAAEFAVRIHDDSMAPLIADGAVVYVNRDPLREGDVGIFCVDGDMFCRQYYKDAEGIVYLFSLNRARADADVILTPSARRRMLVCFGRVMVHAQPLPRKA